MFFREFGFLRVGRFGLVFGFPLAEWHAVENLARFLFADLDPTLGGGFIIPIAEAIPAKARVVHHVDILNIGALAQVIAQAAKGGGFEFGAGGVVREGISGEGFP